MSEKKELRIGVIGAGGRGSLAKHAHKPEEGVRLVAAADTVEKHLVKFKEDYGPDVFVTQNYKELLAQPDIDAVFVTTPDFLHEEHALAALEAGKSVYLEKPMAITIEACDKILKTAYETKKKLYLGHNMRHMVHIQKMKELIDGGAIGEVKAGWCRHFISYGGDAYFKDWHSEREKTTGLLLQKGAHDIDVLHWLCGGYTKRVNAMGALTVYDQVTDRHDPSEPGDPSFNAENWPPLSQTQLNPKISVEDLSMVLMELDNGVFASYLQCHYTPDAWRNYTIIGTEGRLENCAAFPSGGKIMVWNHRVDHPRYEGEEQYSPKPAKGGHGGGDPNIVDEFIRYLQIGGKIKTSPIAARYAVATGYQATMSLRNGGVPMDIPPVDKEIEAYFNADLEK